MNKPSHPVLSSDGGNVAYERDPYGWAIEQAERLRMGRIDLIDWINVAEEIEDVARSERRAAESALRLIMKHMLKWDAQPGRRSRSWQNSIRNGRAQYRDAIEDNPSLAAVGEEMIERAYSRARRDAAAEMGMDEEALPRDRPAWDEVMDKPFVVAR